MYYGLFEDNIMNAGDSLYIITPDILDKIKKNPIIDGKTIGSVELIDNYSNSVDFCNRHKKFHFAIYKTPQNSDWFLWIGVMLFNDGLGYQRVQFEPITCKFCGWEGRGANPNVINMYYKMEQFNLVPNKYELLNCPKCGGKLSRDIIWINDEV